MKGLFAAIAASCALAGIAHAADDSASPRVFKPSGPWAADYGEDYCRLARNFSDGTNQVSLGMDRIQPGPGLRMILIGDGIKYYRSAALIGYRFLPSGEDEKAPFLRSETANGQQYLNLGNIPVAPMQPLGGSSAGMIVKREFVTTVPISTAPHSEPPPPGPKLAPYTRDGEQEYASKISAMLFTDGLSKPVELDTGDLKPVIAALQACTDDLLKYWGLNIDKHRNERRAVQPDGDTSKWLPSGTIGFEDYPKLSGGANMIRLMVDATGKPTDCKIHFASLDDDTNAKLCGALLANAHFKPALDADGKPFASFYTTSPLSFGGGGFGR